MRWLLVSGGLMAMTAVVAAQPGGWLTGSTGRGTARWIQQGPVPGYRGGAAFGWAVLKGTAVRDGSVEVRFRPVEGREDRAGGVVWRWQDGDNYYVARGNALEDNVVAYKVVGGRRIALTPAGTPPGTYGMKTPVAAGRWHTLRVDFSGADFKVTFDGRWLFVVHDETFSAAGAVGVWSKADSVTDFERFEHSGS